MLRILLSKYKWAIGLGLVVLYTIGIWHVSGVYHESSYQKEIVESLEEKLRVQKENENLAHELSAALLENQAKATASAATINKRIKDEVAKYPNPPIPDSVRDKLNATRNTGRSSTPTLP